jgi:hypothetical protein
LHHLVLEKVDTYIIRDKSNKRILLCRVVEGKESVGGVLLGRIVRIIYKGELQKKKEIAYQ